MLGTDLQPEHGPERTGDVRASVADITRARRDLGFEPRVSFEEGLRQTVDWMRNSG
ncbi:MAG: GDP-mannose 4,6-dehydratase [Candidatus Latescibacteria bacterium]|nr:GDP-mannose 4,6-dehydratase [Candidatus Latescibacterota bacterium]